jgi:diphosphomevalonate decarboxylase
MFKTSWKAPSNIAFVKYWGKKGIQLPATPSVSMSLNECFTETHLEITPSDKLEIELFLDDVKNDKFAFKVFKFVESLPYESLKKTKLLIKTKNTFPHGTGIASSASGMSAFGLCLSDYLYHLEGKQRDEHFFKNASSLSRLASGSACRSVFGGFSIWGASDSIDQSSDEFAIPFMVHPSMKHLRDSVLVIDEKEKSVSSTSGHEMMKHHPYSESRYKSANIHFELMITALKNGDFELMGDILEKEALELHALMMTSDNPYILMRPNTLSCLELIKDFRFQTKIPVYFTLDAGPNIHLIYPQAAASKVTTFIENELKVMSKNVIHDFCGEGPLKCL